MTQELKESFEMKLNYTQKDLIKYHVNQWVMDWVKRYHPEAFEEAKKFVKENLNKDEKENT